MFQAAHIPPVPYTDPWLETFETRLASLTRRDRRIAYYYHRPDTSTFRYRVYNMVQALMSGPGSSTSAAWFQQSELDRMENFIDRAHALVICRARYSAALGRMIARAKARGIPVIFDIDDFVFNPDHSHLVMHTLDQEAESEASMDVWFAYLARHGATLRMCDTGIVTNPFLAARVAEVTRGLPIHVVPNFLNIEQQRLSVKLYRAKCQSEFARDGNIHIGYFSGTPTHNKDFAIAAGALAKLMDDDPRLVLRIVGFPPPHTDLARHAKRIDIQPLQDFMNLQRLIAEVEINIAPVQNNLFTNCKSELKYFEAAIVGSMTLASPIYTFQRAIKQGDNGFLAGQHEWLDKLRLGLACLADKDAYAAMAERAFTHATRRFGWDKHVKAIETAVFGETEAKATIATTSAVKLRASAAETEYAETSGAASHWPVS